MGFMLFFKYDKQFQVARLEIPRCKCRKFMHRFIDLNPMFLSFLFANTSVFLHVWLVCATLIKGVAFGFQESVTGYISITFIALHLWAFKKMRGIACGQK